MEEEVNGKMKPDIENKIRSINRSVRKIKDLLERKTPMASDLDMGNKRILNLPPPRDPIENTENYNDPVTVKYLQYNLNGSNKDGSFTVYGSSSLFSPHIILPIAQENKY